MSTNYSSINDQQGYPQQNPYGTGQGFAQQSQGYIAPYPRKNPYSKWLKIGIPVAIVIIVAAVVGGVLGSRKKDDASSSGAGTASGEAAASSAASVKNEIGVFATATNSEFMVPVYPSTTNTAAFSEPTFNPSDNAQIAWPKDSFSPSSPSITTARTDRPRLFAPAYKWQALPNLIENDLYLKSWNETIFGNATAYAALDPVKYVVDGSSGALDVAREVKMRVKAFAYAYRMSNDTKWSERLWAEIQNAATFGPADDKWNSVHFLDVAEFTAAFGLAYDWLHDVWTDDQKNTIVTTMIKYGLQPGVDAINGGDNGWWRNKGTTGNWNCVCNSGLTIGALAILGDDKSGIAQNILNNVIDNAKQNCANGPSADGTWSETANYWYFGTTGHAEMASALLTATGSDYGLLDSNSNFKLTGLYHMHAYGTTSLFNYGDHGPNKFSSTANSMFLYATHYNMPQFALFQRDRADAAEPWSMFWYDPTLSGAYWNDMDLDHYFDNDEDQWAAMRSSWTDSQALYVAVKAGMNQGHQTHNDLDAGDFVLDALGTRWAGELGSADYNSRNYFIGSDQGADRWKYYRKMTEGQNTLVIDKANQNAENTAPTVKFESSGTKQGSSTVLDVPKDSTAYFTADLTGSYFKANSVKRGVRLLNGRRQVLIRDELDTSADVEWRMHTNATINIDTGSNTVSLDLDGKTMKVVLLNPPSGISITNAKPVRYESDPTPPKPDQDNPGVSVLVIGIPSGQNTLEVLFNPQWEGMSDGDFVTPSSVSLDQWSLTSHN
jgi:hypothetical protein